MSQNRFVERFAKKHYYENFKTVKKVLTIEYEGGNILELSPEGGGEKWTLKTE